MLGNSYTRHLVDEISQIQHFLFNHSQRIELLHLVLIQRGGVLHSIRLKVSQSLLHAAELLVHSMRQVMSLLLVKFVDHLSLYCLHQGLSCHLFSLQITCFCVLLNSVIQTNVLVNRSLLIRYFLLVVILLDLQLLNHL